MSHALLALLLGAVSVEAKTVFVAAYDAEGNPLDKEGLLRFIAPVEEPQAPGGGLFLSGLDGEPAGGRSWWVEGSSVPVWNWEGPERVAASLPWPVAADGFSTALLDGGGRGYFDGQSILLNEEIATTSYRLMQESFKERLALKTPYVPGKRTRGMIDRARDMIAEATAKDDQRERALLFDKALQAVSFAWQQMLYEHGRQVAADPVQGLMQRRGLTLDETIVERVTEFGWLASKIQDSGANWVRLVFRTNPNDFAYSQAASFSLYDGLLAELERRKIRVMASPLDSLLWPRGVTPEAYAERVRNIATRYKDRIRSWEVASEPNGDWIGGAREPMTREAVLACVKAGAAEVKRVDNSLETVATLHWWEGTSRDRGRALFPWAKWALANGFARDIDVVALSAYPHRHPLGLAFDPAFRRLAKLFPGRKLMLGGYSFLEGDGFSGYWWLEPGNVRDARIDLMKLYAGVSLSLPRGVGGGFFWPTLSQMLKPGKRVTPLFREYKRSLKGLRR